MAYQLLLAAGLCCQFFHLLRRDSFYYSIYNVFPLCDQEIARKTCKKRQVWSVTLLGISPDGLRTRNRYRSI